MAKRKIVFLDKDSLGDYDLGRHLAQFGEFVAFGNTRKNNPKKTKELVLQRCAGAEIVITNKVVLDAKILGELSNSLKFVQIAATGMNNVDLDVAQSLGIVVKNVAGYSTKSVAQHTLMMALSLCARAPRYDAFVKSGKYSKSGLFTDVSRGAFLLENKRWGIIGLGSIGRAVANLARAFGAEVAYFSTSGANDTSDFLRLNLDELLSTSSVISIHAPLNNRTKGLINSRELGLIKDGAVLLNLGRGGIIDEFALANELKAREIYAGLDVFEAEPLDSKSPLLEPKIAKKLLLTPHNAWGYNESIEILAQGIVSNIKEFVNS